MITMLMASCQSVEKMIDTGNFDSALTKSMQKLRGKKKLKARYVVAAEEAFAKVTQRDMTRVKTLSSSSRAKDYDQVLTIYKRMQRRQEAIQSLLPLVANNGYQASFQFVKVGGLIAQAEDRLVELLKEEAISLLSEGRSGDKRSAREAFVRLTRLLHLQPGHQNFRQMRNEAESLGMVTVRVGVENFTRHLVTRSFKHEMISQGMPSSHWLIYTTDSKAPADYEIRVILEAIEVSPEQVREQVVRRQKEIEDGFDYVLDADGNVMKDTLGNDIKVPRFRDVEARLVTIEQFKSALLAGEIVCRDLHTRAVDVLPIRSEIVFDHAWAVFRGDRRALRKDDRRLLERPQVPFPSDEAMFVDALARISPMIREKIAENTFL